MLSSCSSLIRAFHVYFFLNFLTHILIPADMRWCTHIKITLYALRLIYPSINTFHCLNLNFQTILEDHTKTFFIYSNFSLFRTSISDSWNETNFWRIVWSLIKLFSSFFLPFASWCSFNSSPLFWAENLAHISMFYISTFSFSPGARAKEHVKTFSYGFNFFTFSHLHSLFWSMSFKVYFPSCCSLTLFGCCHALNYGTKSLSILSLSLSLISYFSFLSSRSLFRLFHDNT